MDTRLFQDELLYCENKHKPFFRGKIHLYSLILFPIAFWFLYNGIASSYPFFIASISLFTNFLCFGISAIYHVFDWPSDVEIILQKLDHASISLWCFCMMFPIAFLLLPPPHGIQLICLCAATCTCNLYSIYISKPMIILSAAVPAVLLLYCDTCFIYMTNEEWIYMWCVYAFQIAGTMFFSLKQTPVFLDPDVFGYHEIFHGLSIFTATFVFLLNYSIASRYENTITSSMLYDVYKDVV